MKAPINVNYTNKIGSLFPSDPKTGNPIYHIQYNEAPMVYSVRLTLALVALDFDKDYTIHLTIVCSDGEVKINEDLQLSGNKLSKDNIIGNSNLLSATFSINTRQFEVNEGINQYTASVILIDAQTGQVFDSMTTWFITEPEVINDSR